jgi:hypothetical protein
VVLRRLVVVAWEEPGHAEWHGCRSRDKTNRAWFTSRDSRNHAGMADRVDLEPYTFESKLELEFSISRKYVQ